MYHTGLGVKNESHPVRRMPFRQYQACMYICTKSISSVWWLVVASWGTMTFKIVNIGVMQYTRLYYVWINVLNLHRLFLLKATAGPLLVNQVAFQLSMMWEEFLVE